MCIGDALRELAGFLDGCEDEGLVTDVGLVERHDRGGSRVLSAEVELTMSPSGEAPGGLALSGTSVDDDGRLGLSFRSLDAVVPAPDGRVEVEPTDATFGPDGTVTVTLSAAVPTGETATTDGGPTAGERRGDVDTGGTEERRAAAGDRDVPPFRDPDLLAEVYESCDTFAEMTDAIGMEVTAETVRRYMIDYGIHQPNSYDTSGDAEDAETGAGADDGAERASETPTGDTDDRADDDRQEGPTQDIDEGSPVVLADGIGLPEDVTVETLIETVRTSNTLYEVERDIGVDREDALDMLRDLNLLDLVVGRLATKDRRDIDREDVIERLREASATAAGTPG